MKLRPENPSSSLCDVVACGHEYEVRYTAGADEHRARVRDVRLCQRHLVTYHRELDCLRERARGGISSLTGS